MKIQIAFLWPYAFTAELNFGNKAGAVAYFIQDVSGCEGEEHCDASPPTEITREAYLAIIAGKQAEHIAQIAQALDADGLVACGQLPSIAQSLSDMSDSHGGYELASPDNAADGGQPS